MPKTRKRNKRNKKTRKRVKIVGGEHSDVFGKLLSFASNIVNKHSSNQSTQMSGMGIKTMATYVKGIDGKEKLYDVVGVQVGSYPGDPNSSKTFFGTDDSKPSKIVQKEYLYKLNPDTDTT